MQKTVLLGALVAGTMLGGAAQAQSVAALVGDNTIAIVDAAAGQVTKMVKVSGVKGRLLGIDVRPADGMLYALAADGSVVTIDPMTGAATMKSKLDTMLKPGTLATVDFNPVADRLRVIGADGTNLRANVDDGKVTTDGQLKFADTDAMKGRKSRVIAGAYTNSVKGAKETALYDIDASGAFLKQAPPNDGVLNTVGKLGMAPKTVAFDISTDATGKNEAWAMSGSTLYSIDLATGQGSTVGKIRGLKGTVRDIAALPAMKAM